MSYEDETTEDVEVNETEGEATTPDETESLIEEGKKFRQLREKHPNVDFEEMPRSWTQTRQEVSSLKKELDELKSAPKQDLSPEDEDRKRDLKKLFNDPYVKELIKETVVSPTLVQSEQELRKEIELENSLEKLESKYDGSDGKPKFDRRDIIEYAQENKLPISKLELAYKELNEKELDEWKVKNAMSKKRPSTYSERGRSGSEKAPQDIKPAKDWEEAQRRASDMLSN